MATTATVEDYLSEQEYLEDEKTSPVRHEYVDGYVYAMAGSSVQHNRITMNIANVIYNAAEAEASPCEVFTSDIKVRIKQRESFYYPDVLVSCDEGDDEDPYYKNNPCLIVEVLSESTKHKDRIEKLLAYQTINTLQAYIMVAQDQACVVVVRRNDEGQWFSKLYTDIKDCIALPCLQARLCLEQVYRRVVFISLRGSAA